MEMEGEVLKVLNTEEKKKVRQRHGHFLSLLLNVIMKYNMTKFEELIGQWVNNVFSSSKEPTVLTRSVGSQGMEVRNQNIFN